MLSTIADADLSYWWSQPPAELVESLVKVHLDRPEDPQTAALRKLALRLIFQAPAGAPSSLPDLLEAATLHGMATRWGGAGIDRGIAWTGEPGADHLIGIVHRSGVLDALLAELANHFYTHSTAYDPASRLIFVGEAAAARQWLKAAIEADAEALRGEGSDPAAFISFVDTMTEDELVSAITRTCPVQTWRIQAADLIAEYAAVEEAQWQAEFDAVAARRLYGRYMHAAQGWVGCGRSGARAAAYVGEHVRESHRCGESWAEIAARLSVPRRVVLVWAAAASIRRSIGRHDGIH